MSLDSGASVSTEDPFAAGESPEAKPYRAEKKSFWFQILVVIGVNTLIAALVTLIQACDFLPTLRAAQTIGLSILVFAWALRRAIPSPSWGVSAAAILLGAVFGVAAGMVWDRPGLGHPLAASPRLLTATLAIALTFGVAMSYYFRSRAALAENEARLHDERARQAEDAQRLTEAELRLLQAQVEPHFLFNTLSNILQLIDTSPQGAKRMLLDLTTYLRRVLRRVRAGPTSLGEELELLRAYLDIQAVRMGDRLAYALDCPPELRDVPLPPLLLQPAVESAMRHGLEPSTTGGRIEVRAARDSDRLVLEVLDTGMDLVDADAWAADLAGVRARVGAVSHGQGTFAISPNTPRGTRVRIELPWPVSPAKVEA
jgi:hypothetical protein